VSDLFKKKQRWIYVLMMAGGMIWGLYMIASILDAAITTSR
jgi:hypothetical protein